MTLETSPGPCPCARPPRAGAMMRRAPVIVGRRGLSTSSHSDRWAAEAVDAWTRFAIASLRTGDVYRAASVLRMLSAHPGVGGVGDAAGDARVPPPLGAPGLDERQSARLLDAQVRRPGSLCATHQSMRKPQHLARRVTLRRSRLSLNTQRRVTATSNLSTRPPTLPALSGLVGSAGRRIVRLVIFGW